MAFNVGENVGPYRITDRLGQGGMATVFKAYHANLDRYVALKVLHTAFKEDPTFIARFQREAQIIAKLEHPSIVPIYDYSEHSGEPYLVMKFIEGDTLKAFLSRRALTLEETLRIMTAVAQALTYAHERGVLHRDVKPSNILLEKGTTPYLADFGLARIASAGESTMSQDTMLGTPQYISPEQAQGVKDLTGATDIYSLGVVLYELVVGRVPFTADTPYAIVHDHIYSPLPMPSKVNPQVPQAVERVLLKSLSKDPRDRYRTPVEMVEEFRRAVQESDLKELSAQTYRATPNPVTPMPPAIPGFSDPMRTGTATPSPVVGIPVPMGSTPSLMGSSASQRLEKQRRRENLWVLGGFALLILTCLAGMFIALSTYAKAAELGLLLPPKGAIPLPPNGTPGLLIFGTEDIPAGVTKDDTRALTSTEAPTESSIPTATDSLFSTHDATATPVSGKSEMTDISAADAEAGVEADPSNARAYFILATALVRERKPARATETFQKGLEALHGDGALAMEIARELLDAEKSNKGITQGAFYLYAYALSANHDKDMTVREEAGKYVYQIMLDMTKGNSQLLNRASESLKESKSAGLIAFMALGFNQLGDTQTADDLIAQAVSMKDLPEVHLVRGIILTSRNDQSGAKAEFDSIIESRKAPDWVVEEAQRLSK